MRWLNILALVGGLAALALGPLAGGLFIALSLTGRPVSDPLSVTIIGISMAALGLGLGGGLAWAGYRGLRRQAPRAFQPGIKWLWICLGGLGLALILGQLILSLDLLAPIVFPLFHVLGVVLPAISILVLVARGLKQSPAPASQGHAPAPVTQGQAPAPPSRGQVIGQMAWGAFGTTAISFAMEAAAAVVGLVAVAIIVALTPGGLAQLVELQVMLADPALLQDMEMLARWLLKPGVLLPAALLLVVVAPLIEEAAKSLGVPLLALGMGKKPSAAQSWLWGMAAGAGFAITEGLFNTAAGLPFWAGIALLRAGATAMHMVTAGLTGLGWAQALAARRPRWVMGSYGVSVTLHALWNGSTVLIVVASLWMMARPGDPATTAGGGLAVVAGLMGLVLLAATIIGVAVYVTLRIRRS